MPGGPFVHPVSNVDPTVDGRQHGFVSLPARDAALDRRRVPLTVLRRGDGPRIVLVGGADGERSGSLALHRLAREIDLATLAGTVLIAPDVPREAFDRVVDEIVDTPDTVLELVGAPTGFGFSPMAGLVTGGASDVQARAEDAMIAFGAAESVRSAPGLLPGEPVNDACRRPRSPAAPHVRATLGGGVSPAEALDIALAGCRNVLVAAGALDAPLALRSTRTLALEDIDALVHAPLDGLLELRVRPGQTVYRGNPLALVVEPARTGAEPVVVRVPRDGVVLGARTDARVRAGDCIAIIASETAR